MELISMSGTVGGVSHRGGSK